MDDDTDEPKPFATTDDLAKRWHELTDAETRSAMELLDDASDKIRQRVPETNDTMWIETHMRTLRRICCAMVKRAMQQDSAGVPGGVSQTSETVGPFANSYSWSNPDGNLYLTKEELRDLGVAKQQAFSIDMCEATDGNH
ncbi:phage protein Gp19/Gp15/Gp42 [Bifidobacterium actinocoloniiforme DSM 22766]|uniref:Phage protein Gp19/Gp15/Gp42 n=1 Tax=Bifidobacterium actinocoloniiforme DSM 22766 TaxID=1437605 RepID=A0A086YZU4_9BIFI|nr:Gp19/Gp15/Gp42 family protein [Bifidobacterium actinocoloniiforme]AKV55082.1 hypothetical protein AB656_01090 [Bifidobacterium actinocoloniiforme DSM 22766]KFI39794.1 phage protein Gp19/Gp15/Gp42 [Bifidobacterium actinocoloniiforme DSM 22766]